MVPWIACLTHRRLCGQSSLAYATRQWTTTSTCLRSFGHNPTFVLGLSNTVHPVLARTTPMACLPQFSLSCVPHLWCPQHYAGGRWQPRRYHVNAKIHGGHINTFKTFELTQEVLNHQTAYGCGYRDVRGKFENAAWKDFVRMWRSRSTMIANGVAERSRERRQDHVRRSRIT